MKTCRCCGESKPSSEFVKNKACKNGLDSICLVCNRNNQKIWREKNPEKRKLQVQREADPSKLYNRRKYLKHSYGITVDDYDHMYTTQKGCCAICGVHQSETVRKFHVDHCHSTGKIRGLLCQDCNHLLGRAKDTREILSNAIAYLNTTDTGY